MCLLRAPSGHLTFSVGTLGLKGRFFGLLKLFLRLQRMTGFRRSCRKSVKEVSVESWLRMLAMGAKTPVCRVGGGQGKRRDRLRWRSANTLPGSTICAASIQHWARKIISPSNEMRLNEHFGRHINVTGPLLTNAASRI